jgi:hypothetical protein
MQRNEYSNMFLHYQLSLIFPSPFFLVSHKSQVTELRQPSFTVPNECARGSSEEKDKLEIGSCQGPDWWLTKPWQRRGNYLKLLLHFCFHLVVSLWWLSETETGNVWIGSNGRVEWSHRNECHGRNTNLLSWVRNTSSLLTEPKSSKTVHTVCDFRLLPRYEWNLHSFGPLRRVEQ